MSELFVLYLVILVIVYLINHVHRARICRRIGVDSFLPCEIVKITASCIPGTTDLATMEATLCDLGFNFTIRCTADLKVRGTLVTVNTNLRFKSYYDGVDVSLVYHDNGIDTTLCHTMKMSELRTLFYGAGLCTPAKSNLPGIPGITVMENEIYVTFAAGLRDAVQGILICNKSDLPAKFSLPSEHSHRRDLIRYENSSGIYYVNVRNKTLSTLNWIVKSLNETPL